MNTLKSSLIGLSFIITITTVQAQGTFQNLDFEAASVPTSTAVGSLFPITDALPGWTAYFTANGTNQPQTQVAYDGVSTGGTEISLIDSRAPVFGPLQGNYSAMLFAGGSSASISQTGTLPAGTESLFMDASSFGASPIVAVNGQAIDLIPVKAFANYTLYGGDISSYSGEVTLSFTEPPPLTEAPSEFELDNISFSPNTVPEPSPLILTGIGGLLLALYRRFAPKRK